MMNEQEYESFGKLLRSLRENRGYSLRDLEDKAFVARNQIGGYELGQRFPDNQQIVDSLISALICSPHEASSLQSAWLYELLLRRNVPSELAAAMVFTIKAYLPGTDIEQVFKTVRAAINSDAFDRALTWLEPLKKMQRDLENAAPELEYHSGVAKYGIGHLAEAAEHFEQALRLLRHHHPEPGFWGFLSTGGMVVRQFLNRVFLWDTSKIPGRKRSRYNEETWEITVNACYRLSHIYYVNNDKRLAAYYSLKGLNMAEAAPDMPAAQGYRALFYSNMVATAGFYGNHFVARIYLQRIEALEHISEDPRINYLVNLVLGVYSFGRAQWEDCEARFEVAARLAEERGDLRHVRTAQAFLASAWYWQGKKDESFALFDNLYSRAKRTGDHQIMAVALYSKALRAFHRGKFNHALKFVKTAECLAREKLQDNLIQIQTNGLLLAICARQNQFDVADQHARKIEALAKVSSTTAGSLEGYHRLAEFYLLGWETSGSRAFKEGARRAIKLMATHASIFDVFRPLYWTYKGWYEFLSGKRKKAVESVSQGVQAAKTLQMPDHEQVARQYLESIL